MNVAFWEPFPLTETLFSKILAETDLKKLVSAEKARHEKHYDLVLFEGSRFPEAPFCSAEIWLTPSSCTAKKRPDGLFLTGGMASEDDVLLSSIGENSALICIQQELFHEGRVFLPSEQKIPFDRNFSVYKNLAAGFATVAAKFILGEDF